MPSYDVDSEVRVIGDELVFEGLVIGMLATSGVPATYMDRALECFGIAVNREAMIDDLLEECSCKHLKECPLHKAENGTARSELEEDNRGELLRLLTARAKGGLLRLTDAIAVVNEFMDGELDGTP